jgi:hypothetical protein
MTTPPVPAWSKMAWRGAGLGLAPHILRLHQNLLPLHFPYTLPPAISPLIMADVSEERELQLVDRLELRLALAKDPTKFESLLKTYLCPLLLKLKSPHLNVRNKTVSICMHLGTRIEGEGM